MKPYRTEKTKKEEVREMFDRIAPAYDRLNHTLSFQIDKLWRRRVVRIVRRSSPRRILDVATGTGDLAIALAARIPEAHVLGIDLSEQMLEEARRKVVRRGLDERVLLEEGEADYILSFEQLETARFLPYLKKGGTIISNTQTIDPMPVITGAKEYPQGIMEALADKGVKLVQADALALAEEAGSVKAVNVVLIGVMAKHLGLEKQVWLDTIKETVPAKFVEMNLKAFELGYAQ